ncbi:hypothetical protein [Tetragenococcus solitarius]|uniref:Uncharacterized protein n=1 Tax=Tetragenococcus solitarius TaxID=71453 RepID=A0ABN3Y2S9_9ENTE|nr:hypothetical protein [Tetragenococcus solitarius]
MKFFEWRSWLFLLLAFVFLVFIFQDWPDLWSVAKDIIGVVLNLFVFIGMRNDKKTPVNEHQSIGEEKTDEKIVMKSDQKTLKWLYRLLIFIFLTFIILYYVYDKNTILAAISLVSLFYWSISNLINIIFGYIYTKKYK